MKKIFNLIFGKREQPETRPQGVRIQSSCWPEKVAFNEWAMQVHRECQQTFLRK